MAYTGLLSTWLDKIKSAITGLSVNGTTITYSKNDGTTGTITTQDTTYGNATTTTAGLMSAQDKTKLDGLSSSGGNYLPLSGGTVTGDVTIEGDFTVDSIGTLSTNTLTVDSESYFSGDTWCEAGLSVDGVFRASGECALTNLMDCTYPVANWASTATIDETLGNIIDLYLTQNSNLTFAGNRPQTTHGVFTLGYRILTLMISTNGYSLTWNNVLWADGITPTLDSTKLNIVKLIQFFANDVDDDVDPLYFGVYVGSFDVS